MTLSCKGGHREGLLTGLRDNLGMASTASPIADFASPTVDRLSLAEQRIDPSLCDNPADLAQWLALPVALSILIWGCLLHIAFI